MIQQMMMLMRLEMQMRQQALLNFEQSQESNAEQTPGLDDALALSSQLSEINSALSTLIRSNAVRPRSGRRRPAHRDLPGPQRLRRTDGPGFARSAALRRLSNLSARHWREIDAVEEANDSSEDDESCDEDEVVDMASPAPASVDEFIWHQLTESDPPEGRSSMTASPDGMSAVSFISGFQSVSYTPSIGNVHSVPSDQSLVSGMSDVSYVSSVPVSISPAASPMRYEACDCVNECTSAAARCSCELCAAFDGMAVVDDIRDDDDDVFLRSHDTVPRPNPLLACDGTHDARPLRQLGVPTLLTRTAPGAAAYDLGLSNESVSSYHTLSTLRGGLTCTSVNRHTLQPVVAQGRGFIASQTSLPAVGQESVPVPNHHSPLSWLPGTSRPPHFNYAARLRRQASEMTPSLPSEVSIRPWPLSDTGQTTRYGNQLTPARGAANQRAILTSPGSGHQLARQSSVMTGAAQRGGSTYRSRNTRPSRYNASFTGARCRRTSRP